MLKKISSLIFGAFFPNWLVGLLVLALFALLGVGNGQLMPALRHCHRMMGRDFWFTTRVLDFDYRGHSRDLIDRRILAHGAYEKPMLFFLRDWIKAAGIEDKNFLDVGANTGQHSLYLASKMEEVLAFEPFPPVLERFKKNVELNNFDNIRIFELGLGNAEAKLDFFEPKAGNQMTGTFADDSGEGKKKVGTFSVVRGDAVIDKASAVRIKLMKMDIEGYERFALEGLEQTLAAGRPVVVQELTSHTKAGFHTEQELRNAYPDNYEFYYLLDDDVQGGAYRIKAFDFNFDPALRHTLLALPAESVPVLKEKFGHAIIS